MMLRASPGTSMLYRMFVDTSLLTKPCGELIMEAYRILKSPNIPLSLEAKDHTRGQMSVVGPPLPSVPPFGVCEMVAG